MDFVHDVLQRIIHIIVSHDMILQNAINEHIMKVCLIEDCLLCELYIFNSNPSSSHFIAILGNFRTLKNLFYFKNLASTLYKPVIREYLERLQAKGTSLEDSSVLIPELVALIETLTMWMTEQTSKHGSQIKRIKYIIADSNQPSTYETSFRASCVDDPISTNDRILLVDVTDVSIVAARQFLGENLLNKAFPLE